MLKICLRIYKSRKMRRTSSCHLVVEQKLVAVKEEANVMASATPRRQKNCEGMLALLVMIPLLVALIPSPIDPVAYRYSNKSMPELVGILAVNKELQKATKIQFSEKLIGAESFAVDKSGLLYSGLKDGRIVQMNVTEESFSVISRNTVSSIYCDAPGGDCRRPLGMDFDLQGNLIVADIFRGLVKINVTTGHEEFLIDDTIGFNNLVVLPNGSIFLTQFCQRRDFLLEVFEGIPGGRLLHYDPSTGRTHTVVSDLFLPNGMSLSNDGGSILISESGKARIVRYFISGPKAGEWEVFVDNLPGLPDNIQPASDGGYWVAFPLLRSPCQLDFVAENPWIRKLLVHFRLLIGLMPKHGMVARIDETGEIVRTLHDQGGQTLYSISEAFEYNNELLIGTFEAPFIGRIKLNPSET